MKEVLSMTKQIFKNKLTDFYKKPYYYKKEHQHWKPCNNTEK